MMKPWFYSKTIWVNLLALAATGLIGQSDVYVNPQIMVVGLALLNLGLRLLTTEAVALRPDDLP